jgi:hypothetical protein
LEHGAEAGATIAERVAATGRCDGQVFLPAPAAPADSALARSTRPA